jgi:hypothetical protein
MIDERGFICWAFKIQNEFEMELVSKEKTSCGVAAGTGYSEIKAWESVTTHHV